MHVVIDLVNGDDIVVSETSKKQDEKSKEENLKKLRNDKLVRKQVININGEIVSI